MFVAAPQPELGRLQRAAMFLADFGADAMHVVDVSG
jgi:hypothetical protein